MTFYIVTQSTWIATFAYIVYRQVKQIFEKIKNKLNRYLWMYTHGIAALIVIRFLHITDQKIDTV